MADVSKLVEIVLKATDNASAPLSGITGKLDDLEGAASGAAPEIEGVGKGLDDLSGKESMVDGLATAFKTLAAAVVVKEFIDANVAAESFLKTIEYATGSSEAAAAEYDYLRGVANRLGLEITSTAEAYGKWYSASVGTTLEGEKAKEVFEAFVGTMSALGLSSADVSGALTQLQQGISKGKYELEDLKGVAERIPGFFGKFSESLGVTTAELYDMISAGQIGAEEIYTFAQSLNADLAGVDFNTFTNELNRMKNGLNDAYLVLGESGVFTAITEGVRVATAAVVGAVASFELLGEVIGIIAGALATGDFTSVGDAIEQAMLDAGDKTKAARDQMIFFREESDKAGDAGESAGKKTAEAMDDAETSVGSLQDAQKALASALKELGLDPKQLEKPIELVIDAFNRLASNPLVTGDQILSGLLVTLDKISDGPTGAKALDDLRFQIEDLFQAGKIDADEYAAAINAVQVKFDGLWVAGGQTKEQIDKVAEATKKAAEESEKAAEAAREYELKLLEIASNERIALIEAKFELDIAEVEANAQVAERLLTNLSEMYQADVGLIGELAGQITDGYSSGDRFRMQLINDANERIEEMHKAQLKQIDAYADYMRAKTAAIQSGNPILTVNADGLQPHLEGIMWELFKEIQIKLSQEGGDLIVGGLA